MSISHLQTGSQTLIPDNPETMFNILLMGLFFKPRTTRFYRGLGNRAATSGEAIGFLTIPKLKNFRHNGNMASRSSLPLPLPSLSYEKLLRQRFLSSKRKILQEG